METIESVQINAVSACVQNCSNLHCLWKRTLLWQRLQGNQFDADGRCAMQCNVVLNNLQVHRRDSKEIDVRQTMSRTVKIGFKVLCNNVICKLCDKDLAPHVFVLHNDNFVIIYVDVAMPTCLCGGVSNFLQLLDLNDVLAVFHPGLTD